MMFFLLRLRKGDLLDVARELGVEVNGDLRKVEIKDRDLQKENDIETIKVVMEGVLEANERVENKEREEQERERLSRTDALKLDSQLIDDSVTKPITFFFHPRNLPKRPI
ncbi:hypothetical protein TNCV_4677421 [Trichonephila clavipes]|nr:hypothetical protein TNCV_4677421 [Trichonephila clavipes]